MAMATPSHVFGRHRANQGHTQIEPAPNSTVPAGGPPQPKQCRTTGPPKHRPRRNRGRARTGAAAQMALASLPGHPCQVGGAAILPQEIRAASDLSTREHPQDAAPKSNSPQQANHDGLSEDNRSARDLERPEATVGGIVPPRHSAQSPAEPPSHQTSASAVRSQSDFPHALAPPRTSPRQGATSTQNRCLYTHEEECCFPFCSGADRQSGAGAGS